MSLNTYKDINELPILNWFSVHETENYRGLVKDDKILENDDIIELILLWDVLNNQFIERFGLSDDFQHEMRIRNDIAEYQAEWIITKDNYYKTLIRIEEEKLKTTKVKVDDKQSLERTLAKMSKQYSFKLDSRDLTTEQYYSYLYELIDGKKV